jgi:hypothetical protein
MSESNTTITNLNKNIHWTESFRPVTSDKTITDQRYDLWRQITATGWERISDNYFWPCDPRNENNFIGQLPPTIIELDKERRLKFPNSYKTQKN